MNITTFPDINTLIHHFNFNPNYVINDPDIHKVETECDLNDRKLHDAELLTVMASNSRSNCLELGTSYGQSSFKISQNLPEGLTLFTANILPEQFSSTSGELITHLIPHSEIGQYYKERNASNIVQFYEDTSNWLIPNIVNNLSFAFIDASHDSLSVLNDSKLVWPRIAQNGFLIWHDFNYELANKFNWINSVSTGALTFCEQQNIKNIYHLKDSWMSFVIKES